MENVLLRNRISQAIRDTLDARGTELTWSDTNAAAEAVIDEISDELELAWMYEELTK